VKLSLQNATIILLAGMLLVLSGVLLQTKQAAFANPTILSGLAVEFLGTIWLVLCLNQRRKKS
jgi:hypothetical protein